MVHETTNCKKLTRISLFCAGRTQGMILKLLVKANLCLSHGYAIFGLLEYVAQQQNKGKVGGENELIHIEASC